MPYYAGLDLAQADDYTALVVLEAGEPRARAVLVERFRGLAYTAAVDRVAGALAPFRDLLALVDSTGVGRAVVDLLRVRAPWLRMVPVHLHGGARIRRAEDGLHVPKRTLMQPLRALLSSGRLEIPSGPLADELRSFAVRIDPRTGHDRYEARRGHDDLVVAASLAALPLAGERSRT
ncbi:MAG: hypothetical protein U0529_00415 [Thermoanaerobaculia bacterium]